MRSRATTLAATALALLASSLAGHAFAFEEANAPQIRPDQDKATVVFVSGDWAVWRTSEIVEETRFNRGVSFIHRFYRQRLSEPVADFAFRMAAGPGWGDHGLTITPDGVIVFADRYCVKWCDAKGTVSASDEVRSGMICRVYADGIVVQAGARSAANGKGTEAARAMFIPFQGTTLDFENQVQVAPAGLKSLRYDEPARHAGTLAWMTHDKLHFFNLKTGMGSTVPVDDKHGTEFSLHSASVIAFDGETILAGSNVVLDAKTGSRLASNWNDKRINGLFATRNRIGYRLNNGRLEAIDIMHSDRPPAYLADVPHARIFQNDSGLAIWTGTKWKILPWLTALPRDGVKTGD